MNSKILLKEIPNGKFHSAIFTTYSLNLYYLEQQVIPMLGSKGVHYVSILVDSNMLNTQLDSFSFLCDQRKRSYAIHGIQCNGAFHPKIIFLAGDTSLLLLIGSGNLTTSGHGKNLEVWNAIYIDNKDDLKLGFALQAWEYIKKLHHELGASAQQKLKTIEENCYLLSNTVNVPILSSFPIDENLNISFLATNSDNSLFNQLSAIIDNDKINKITIMCPFYDNEGKFIQLLNEQFCPVEFNIVLQKKFGNPPYKLVSDANMFFYDWEDVRSLDIKQHFFHAKNIVFESKSHNYLLNGSANASIAAFGNENVSMINQEACVLYRSNNQNFIELIGLNLNSKKTKLIEFEPPNLIKKSLESDVEKVIFIKTIEKSFNYLILYISAKKKIDNAQFCLYDAKANILFQKVINIENGYNTIKIDIDNNQNILYGLVISKKSVVSNKQFVIDVNAFEYTNPSPRNRSLNQIRKLIDEEGVFSSPKIIDYLNTIFKQKYSTKDSNRDKISKVEEKKDNKYIEEESELLYLSYDQIQEKIKNHIELQHPRIYTQYKSVRLWESIFSYLKKKKENEEQALIDEEETEDINKSTGRNNAKKSTAKNPISITNYDNKKEKVKKFFEHYVAILNSKTNNKEAESPNLIDLSMYLIMMEVLLHLLNHKEKVNGQDAEVNLLPIHFSKSDYSWSNLIISLIGLFTLWCSQKNGFKEIISEEYTLKLELYKKMAFQTTVSALVFFSEINKNSIQEKIIIWKNLGLLNTKIAFNTENINYKDPAQYLEFVPIETREIIGDYNFTEEVSFCLDFLSEFDFIKSLHFKNQYYLHPEDGFTYIDKVITQCNNSSVEFLKLIRIGYIWNKDNSNFCNNKLYCINKSKWLEIRKK